MASITFDSIEILNTTYIPRFVKHETVADRLITSLPRAREDGQTLIVERYGVKKIYLQGSLIGTTEADLDAKIDVFTELFSRKEKNLDVSWNTGTRRYVASCTAQTFDRDHYNTNMVPWTAEFTVLSGVGKDTSPTQVKSAFILSVATPASDNFNLLGSKPGLPILKVDATNTLPSNALGIEYKNVNTGELMQITDVSLTNSTSPVFIIDCETKTVTLGGKEVNFYGSFPTFKLGITYVEITVGGLVNQETGSLNSFKTLDSTTLYVAQAFSVPYTDDTFQGLKLEFLSNGTPTANIVSEIYTGTNGVPDTVITGATFTYTPTDIGATGYITKYSATPFKLESGKQYWIVSHATVTDAVNYLMLGTGTNAYPEGGPLKVSTDGGVTYLPDTVYTNQEVVFTLLYGGSNDGTGTIKHTVDYTKKYL